MVQTLLQIHSATRYAVLAVAAAALVKFTVGLARKQRPALADRILGSTFTGLLDLQIVLGLSMVLAGLFYRALIGHIAMMVLAAGVAHVALVVNKRRAEPGYVLPLVAVLGALGLIAGGLLAIGRGLLEARAL
ncbi:MAG TPA: hypothetical protein VGK67_18480 [Myxococcales bacterium]|jgi:hypothetical protein